MFGLNKKKIYPIVLEKKENEFETKECSICLNEITIKATMPCGHSFCSDCILDWMKKKMNCPNCRMKFKFAIKK